MHNLSRCVWHFWDLRWSLGVINHQPSIGMGYTSEIKPLFSIVTDGKSHWCHDEVHCLLYPGSDHKFCFSGYLFSVSKTATKTVAKTAMQLKDKVEETAVSLSTPIYSHCLDCPKFLHTEANPDWFCPLPWYLQSEIFRSFVNGVEEKNFKFFHKDSFIWLVSAVDFQPMISEFTKEQRKFVDENREAKRQSEAAVPPWVGYNEETTMKEQILALSLVRRASWKHFVQ